MISAKLIQHSVSPEGIEIVTYELEYQRFIHAEFLTHNMFSKNSASSRAIPVAKLIDMVRTNPAEPVHWGKNQPGMQAKEQFTGADLIDVKTIWYSAVQDAADHAESMAVLGVHKQVANRILEPFQWMKVVCTFTEGKNFFWLRDHEDAQPEIKELAQAMLAAYNASTPFKLNSGEWHVPYVERCRDFSGKLLYILESIKEDHLAIPDVETDRYVRLLTLEEALKVSASCCAQVSYRLLDQTLEKALMIYDRLVSSEPVHASPFEHQATPIAPAVQWDSDHPWRNGLNLMDPTTWEKGVTHMCRDRALWSANYKGWIQHRQLIPGNARMGGITNG